MARTRARIIETARQLLPASADLPVDEIAARAGVSVQTLYTHFGSKRGLLLAVIDTLQRDVGLYSDFDHVWSSHDGETALRRMLEATLRLWHRAWPFVSFTERVRRTDEEIRRHMLDVDGYRRANLVTITERLEQEGRLRTGLDAGSAAQLAFALSLPSVYEELVVLRGWPLERAADKIVTTVTSALVDPSTAAVTGPAADWSSALRADSVMP
jgi:AcrR family transcriptional regulator